jgi:hypothetical protein
MGGTTMLTGGSGLQVGERRERERGRVADWWGRSVRGGAGARVGPEWAQPRGEGFSFFSFSVFYFLFLFFYFCFFLFPFLLNQQFAKKS